MKGIKKCKDAIIFSQILFATKRSVRTSNPGSDCRDEMTCWNVDGRVTSSFICGMCSAGSVSRFFFSRFI